MKPIRGDFSADKRLILLTAMAIPIGAICTLVARTLLTMINFFTNLFFYGTFSIANQSPSLHWGMLTILIPALGGLLIGLMARYGSERIRGHGIPEALEVILYGKSIMQPKIAILKPLSSAIAIGSGGPFGAEGPIIMTGGAFGSLCAQLFHLTPVERKILLVSGAAAGMSAIFGTPVAAVLLAVELLLFEWKPRSLVPVAAACATAVALRPLVLESALPLFHLPTLPPLTWEIFLEAIPVGLLMGLCAMLLSKALYYLEDQFHRLPIHWSWWPALGGLVVGIGGYANPRVLGVGYQVIEDFLNARVSVGEATQILIFKALVWLFALSSGTSGGVLAPLLMMGAGLGLILSKILIGPTLLWPLIGMAAVMGGTMRAPFTAIVFGLELTGEVQVLPVLMVACIMSYALTVLVMPRSILTEKIARRDRDVYQEYDIDPLERVPVREVMSKEVHYLRDDCTLGEALTAFQFTPTTPSIPKGLRGLPVIDSEQRVVGVVTMGDAIAWVQRLDLSTATLNETIKSDAIVITPRETCRAAAELMAQHGVGRLPVVDPNQANRLIGIVTRSDLLKARAQRLEEESKRERVIGAQWRSKAPPTGA